MGQYLKHRKVGSDYPLTQCYGTLRYTAAITWKLARFKTVCALPRPPGYLHCNDKHICSNDSSVQFVRMTQNRDMKNTRTSTFSSIHTSYPCHTENSSPLSPLQQRRRSVAPRRIDARASRNVIQLPALSVDGGTTNGKYVKFEDSLLSYIAHCISFMVRTGSLSLWLAVVVPAATELRKSHRIAFLLRICYIRPAVHLLACRQ